MAKEYFVNGLWKDLKVKVLCKEPNTFCEAIRFARLKYRRLMFKVYKVEVKLPRWEPERLETATKESTMPIPQAQSFPIPINNVPSKPSEGMEYTKKVLMEETTLKPDKESYSQRREEVQLESKSESDLTSEAATRL